MAMNVRNGIPIVQSVTKAKKPQGRLWMAIPNPYTRYIEMFMTVDGCEVSVIMPYKKEWVQQYTEEGWHTKKVWDVDERRNA
ncbi:hypothetical protein [Lysinibacillus pakistanensis]|uniref:Uncharacterized protein n=1 Tax=Lysinibacillus pakistanensis TaxID=759811 RepID=A0AAX3WXJ8_9BACI|nr:hypothetical protein [Lysinibacillus pakistanensis]MDM5231460.1 hypothetical protein [Lysinibacillus pakistanensis]WHY47007.1 hypothetical protein QNH22_01965 [Lysinibacillus pakistanensis]WHY52019.1 hypothetical protein QNH24_01960 [Lysinibacillus pakistanensis]